MTKGAFTPLFTGPYRVVSEARRHVTSAVRDLDRSEGEVVRTLAFSTADPYAYRVEVLSLVVQYRELRARLADLHRRTYTRWSDPPDAPDPATLTRPSKYCCPALPVYDGLRVEEV